MSTGISVSIPPVESKDSTRSEVALLEPPDQDAEGGAERHDDEHERLDRHEHRPGEQEQQHERGEDHHAGRERRPSLHVVDEVVDERRLPRDPDRLARRLPLLQDAHHRSGLVRRRVGDGEPAGCAGAGHPDAEHGHALAAVLLYAHGVDGGDSGDRGDSAVGGPLLRAGRGPPADDGHGRRVRRREARGDLVEELP